MCFEESIQGVEVRFTGYLGFKESSDSGTSETYRATTISAVKEKSSLYVFTNYSLLNS